MRPAGSSGSRRPLTGSDQPGRTSALARPVSGAQVRRGSAGLQVEGGADGDGDFVHGVRVDPAGEFADAVFADGGDAVQADDALDWLDDGEGDEDVGGGAGGVDGGGDRPPGGGGFVERVVADDQGVLVAAVSQ